MWKDMGASGQWAVGNGTKISPVCVPLSQRDCQKLAGGEARPDPSGLAGTTGLWGEDPVPRQGHQNCGGPFLPPLPGRMRIRAVVRWFSLLRRFTTG